MMQSNIIKENQITIPMGGLEVSQGSVFLKTFVGSCVAICLFDSERKIGGMAHVMLPKNNTGKTTLGTTQSGKFADEAIHDMIEKMKTIFPILKIEAKIAGGAKIFSHETEDGVLNIGNKNVLAIHKILNEKKIPIIAKSIGANHGRWVTLSCETQRVMVKEKDGEKIL